MKARNISGLNIFPDRSLSETGVKEQHIAFVNWEFQESS